MNKTPTLTFLLLIFQNIYSYSINLNINISNDNCYISGPYESGGIHLQYILYSMNNYSFSIIFYNINSNYNLYNLSTSTQYNDICYKKFSFEEPSMISYGEKIEYKKYVYNFIKDYIVIIKNEDIVNNTNVRGIIQMDKSFVSYIWVNYWILFILAGIIIIIIGSIFACRSMYKIRKKKLLKKRDNRIYNSNLELEDL